MLRIASPRAPAWLKGDVGKIGVSNLSRHDGRRGHARHDLITSSSKQRLFLIAGPSSEPSRSLAPVEQIDMARAPGVANPQLIRNISTGVTFLNL
jgi:hypothetical protein